MLFPTQNYVKKLSQWIFAQIICAGTQGAVIRTIEVYVYPCY